VPVSCSQGGPEIPGKASELGQSSACWLARLVLVGSIRTVPCQAMEKLLAAHPVSGGGFASWSLAHFQSQELTALADKRQLGQSSPISTFKMKLFRKSLSKRQSPDPLLGDAPPHEDTTSVTRVRHAPESYSHGLFIL
jgi:hypothetical protein